MIGGKIRQPEMTQTNQVFSHANLVIYRMGRKHTPRQTPLRTANSIPVNIELSACGGAPDLLC
jgi:hypothetical protein